MALDEFTRRTVDTKLGSFCENRIPPHVRNEIKLTYSFWRDSVILYEERPAWDNPSEWTKMKVARMEFDTDSRGWTLYAYDRNERSFFYPELRPNATLDEAIEEIGADPTCIFWG